MAAPKIPKARTVKQHKQMLQIYNSNSGNISIVEIAEQLGMSYNTFKLAIDRMKALDLPVPTFKTAQNLLAKKRSEALWTWYDEHGDLTKKQFREIVGPIKNYSDVPKSIVKHGYTIPDIIDDRQGISKKRSDKLMTAAAGRELSHKEIASILELSVVRAKEAIIRIKLYGYPVPTPDRSTNADLPDIDEDEDMPRSAISIYPEGLAVMEEYTRLTDDGRQTIYLLR